MEFQIEDDPEPGDIEVLETEIRREASAVMGLGEEVELAIFVRDGGAIVAGIGGWTWGDCCELQSLWVHPSLRGRGLATRLTPPLRPRRRREVARRPFTSPMTFRLATSTSATGTNWWVESRTSHPELTPSGTRKPLKR